MNKKLRILLAIIVLTAAILACGPNENTAPASTARETKTDYIRVAGGHPKTLDLEMHNAVSGDCPDWVGLTSIGSVSFTPGLDVTEGDYTCHLTNGSVELTLVISVDQVEPIPHFDYAQTAEIVAGQEGWIEAESEIAPGNVYYTFSGLPVWMTYDEMNGSRAGFIRAIPPSEAVGQTFVITVNTEDYVNLSMTETITITVTVEPGNLKQEVTLTAGQPELVYVDSEGIIPYDGTYHLSVVSGPGWVTCDEQCAKSGYVMVNPPQDAAGQTFTVTAQVTDEYLGEATVTITLVVQ